MKKKCDELKSENKELKEELSLRKEKSHPSSKRSIELISSGRKYVDKRGLCFIYESTTPSNSKTTFF